MTSESIAQQPEPAAEYRIYTTDTSRNLTGGDLSEGEWFAFERAGSFDERKPLSYAVHQATDAAWRLACDIMREQGVKNTPYSGVDRPIVDDGRITAAITAIRDAMAARAAKLATQAPPPQYRCAGAKDGCPERVHSRGDYCDSCAHDES